MQLSGHFAGVAGSALVIIAGSIASHGQGSTAVLGLEKASQLGGPWQPLPVNQSPLTADGKLVDPSAGGSGYYRLSIQTTDTAGQPVGLPLAAVPPMVRTFVQDHLDSLRTDEPEWADAVLGPVVVPVFHPAVGAGGTPAFYEFKVIGPGGRPISPVDPRPDRGFILASSGPHFFPIGEYATQGPTPTERLRFIAGSFSVHIVRYSADYWVAEDEKGERVASLGTPPYWMPEEILNYIGKDIRTTVLDGKVVLQGERPAIEPKAYGSYLEFKQDVISGPVHTVLRGFTSERAAVDWGLRVDKTPEVLTVPLDQAVLVLDTLAIASADVEDPIAELRPAPTKGLVVTGKEAGATLLMVINPDRKARYYVLAVGEGGFHGQGWTSWSSSYAGSCSDIPKYTQEYGLSGCCPSDYSGCGPTAWAMFYGYWDNRGVTGLIGGAGATPWSNNDDVRACIRAVFDFVDTWCTINDCAATNPWDMTDGTEWAPDRGESIDLDASWTVPSTSSGPRNRAKDSIIGDGRPAIVGTGFYAHYPLAYGYRSRQYKALGIAWRTERNWRVYQGWGGSGCAWVNANDCWYGTRGRCF